MFLLSLLPILLMINTISATPTPSHHRRNLIPWQVTQSHIELIGINSISYQFEIRSDAPKFQATCNSTSPFNTYRPCSWNSISGKVVKVETNARLGPSLKENWIRVNVTGRDPVAVWSAGRFGGFDGFLTFLPTYTMFAEVPDGIIA